MDYKVLYRKYRPNDFSNLIGQEYIVTILKNSIQKQKISHAYIFSGPRGTGKTSTAKIFAKAINCLNPTENGPCNNCISCKNFKESADIIEIDAASNNGVDEIREIINNIKLAPAYSKYKVYIIDEVHMLSTSAFNALLLTLEEPPKHVVFILATTNIEAVPITILSRCQRFDFHKIDSQEIIKRLKYIVELENISIDDDALEEIAYISDGGMRDALSILDQLSSDKHITLNEVAAYFGSVSKKQINDLYDNITNNNVEEFIEMMQKFKSLAIDYKLLIKKIIDKIEEQAIKSKTKNNYDGLPYNTLKEIAFELAKISNYINVSIDPYVLIEITLLKYFQNNEEQTKPIIDQKNEKIISREIIPQPETSEINPEIIKIRINNCFVNAQKTYLQKIKEKWPQLLSSIQNKSLLNLLIDSEVVAASDKIVIITNNLESSANLINTKLEELSENFTKKFNEEYKFIAVSTALWQKEKANYIKNIKNGIKYNYILEPQEEELNQELNLETIAYTIFDKEKIEIN